MTDDKPKKSPGKPPQDTPKKPSPQPKPKRPAPANPEKDRTVHGDEELVV